MREPRGSEGPEIREDPIDPNGHFCPECATPRGADNTPSCGCGQRASDALRDARTAEAAAAEDFDPLRIRPYVELGGDAHPKQPANNETMPLRTAQPPNPGAGPNPAPPPALPTPLAPPATTPSARDLSLFEPDAAVTGEDGTGGGSGGAARRRRKRKALLGAGGALVAVFAAAGLTGGLLSYESPSRDTARPEDIRAGVPPVPSTGDATRASSPAETAKRPASPSLSPSGTESPSGSPPPTKANASPARPSLTQPTSTAFPAPSTGPQESAVPQDPAAAPTLRRGDRGPEVTELELRLAEVQFYARKASGSYNEGVEDAVHAYQLQRGIRPEAYGVYDLVTRARLESETTEP